MIITNFRKSNLYVYGSVYYILHFFILSLFFFEWGEVPELHPQGQSSAPTFTLLLEASRSFDSSARSSGFHSTGVSLGGID